jgi:hypothetical protein
MPPIVHPPPYVQRPLGRQPAYLAALPRYIRGTPYRGWPAIFSSVLILPSVANAGLIGSPIGSSLDENERPALQKEVLNALAQAEDNRAFEWSSSNGKTAVITPTTALRADLRAAVPRQSNIDQLPAMEVIGELYVLKEESDIYSGPSSDKAVVAHLNRGETIIAMGKLIDAPWYVVGRDKRAIGYVPVDRLQTGPVEPDADKQQLYLSSLRGRPQSAGKDQNLVTDSVQVTTPCRAVDYQVVDGYRTLESENIVACKTALGGWVEAAAGQSGRR